MQLSFNIFFGWIFLLFPWKWFFVRLCTSATIYKYHYAYVALLSLLLNVKSISFLMFTTCHLLHIQKKTCTEKSFVDLKCFTLFAPLFVTASEFQHFTYMQYLIYVDDFYIYILVCMYNSKRDEVFSFNCARALCI